MTGHDHIQKERNYYIQLNLKVVVDFGNEENPPYIIDERYKQNNPNDFHHEILTLLDSMSKCNSPHNNPKSRQNDKKEY